jgi:phage portal protein BeeE
MGLFTEMKNTAIAIRHGVPKSLVEFASKEGISMEDFKKIPSTLPIGGMLNLATLTPGSNGFPPEKNIGGMLDAYSETPWLRAVVHRISHATAAVPWVVLEPASKGSTKDVKRVSKIHDYKTREKEIKELTNSGKLRIIDDHPFIDLMTHGNPRFSGYLLRQVSQAHIDLTGETFWLMLRPGPTEPPEEIWPIPPEWIKETPKPGGKPVYVVKTPGQAEETLIPASEVLWFVDPNPRNPYGRGSGTTKALADEIDTDEYAAKHTKAWFWNRAKPEVLISIEGLKKDETERLERDWWQKHGTFWNAFKAHFLNRDVKVHELTHKFSDMELVELRKFERDTIVEVFGVPPEILGIIQNSNRATIDAADYIFARWVLVPRLELQRSVLQTRLAPLYGKHIVLHYVSPIEEDREFKLKVMEKAPWAYTVDEWRAVAGHEAAKRNGDIHLVPLNHVPVKDFGELASLLGLGEKNGDNDDVGDKDKALVIKSTLSPTLERAISKISMIPFVNVMSPFVQEIVIAFGKEVGSQLGIDFDLATPIVAEFLRFQGTANAHRITENTKTKLRSLLAGQDNVKDLIASYFLEAKMSRCSVIARTEATRSAGFASWQAILQSGQPNKKWLSSGDSRLTHDDLDGKIIGTKEEFRTFSGSRGQHPAAFDDVNENANCRCFTVPASSPPAMLASLSALRMSFENRLRINLRVAFAAQENALLDELKR